MTLRIGFDPTQCACAHDMSNRLIAWKISRAVETHFKKPRKRPKSL